MRWTALTLAIFCLGAAAWLLKTSTPAERGGESRYLEELLRSSNQQAVQQLEQRLQALGDLSVDLVSRWRSKDKNYREFWNKADAPKSIWFEERFLRPSSFLLDDSLREAMASFAKQGQDKFSLQLVEGRYWFLLRSYLLGQVVVSLYPAQEFWGSLEGGKNLQQWILSAEAQVLRHPTARFLGERADNLKLVSKALEELLAGHEVERFERYLALDGREHWGVWSSLPAQRLVIVTEWQGSQLPASADALPPSFHWPSLLLVAAAGFFCALFFFGFTRTNQEAPADAAAFTPAELTDPFVRYSQLWNAAIASQHPKEFWALFLKILQTASGAAVVGSYRYVSASYSLVPEEHCGLELQDQIAQRYWRESRIFLGSAKYLDRVESTEAFDKWNDTRLRFMPQAQGSFAFLPVAHAKGAKACIAFYFENPDADSFFKSELPLFVLWIRTATVLYEQKLQLLDLSYAKNIRRASDGAPNHFGSEPPLS